MEKKEIETRIENIIHDKAFTPKTIKKHLKENYNEEDVDRAISSMINKGSIFYKNSKKLQSTGSELTFLGDVDLNDENNWVITCCPKGEKIIVPYDSLDDIIKGDRIIFQYNEDSIEIIKVLKRGLFYFNGNVKPSSVGYFVESIDPKYKISAVLSPENLTEKLLENTIIRVRSEGIKNDKGYYLAYFDGYALEEDDYNYESRKAK